MAIENTDNFQGLNAASPSGSAPTNEGDDELRQLKSVLKIMMPGENGQGWSIPVTATEAELNYVSGVSSSIQTQLNNLADSIGNVPGYLYAPAGTAMLFYQGVAPEGWTVSLDFSSHMIVATYPEYAGGTTGTQNPLAWSHAHGTQAMTLNVSQIPSHYHQMQGGNDGVVFGGGAGGSNTTGTGTFDMGDTAVSGGGGSHTHGNTLAVDFTPLAATVIIAIKD